MTDKKNIFVINGSASEKSANQQLIAYLGNLSKDYFNFIIYEHLKILPHFDPGLSIDHTPSFIADFRDQVKNADGILICTPEYVFSIPSGLKNALEWCVSTTIFSGKPVGLITASASGIKGHEELQLIMKTLMARFTDQTTLLIQGVRGKISDKGAITDRKILQDLTNFVDAFKTEINRLP